MIKHLHRAGIVVLLLVDKKQADTIQNKSESYLSNWLDEGADAKWAADYIREQSVFWVMKQNAVITFRGGRHEI